MHNSNYGKSLKKKYICIAYKNIFYCLEDSLPVTEFTNNYVLTIFQSYRIENN